MSLSDPPDAATTPEAETPGEPGGAMRYRVRHISAYRYGANIMLAHHLLHLSPRQAPRQRILSHRLTIDPAPSALSRHLDYFGNPTSYFELTEPHMRLSIESEIEIEVEEPRYAPADMDAPWDSLAAQLAEPTSRDARAAGAFAYPSGMVALSAEVKAYALPSFPPGRGIGAAAFDLTRRIRTEFTFDPSATTIATPVAEVLRNRRGVCQDFAHLQIACLRALGLSARYVSGYLRTTPPPGRPRAIGADVSHAWLSVWCGGELWLDLDPTNGRAGSSDLITLAWGRDYGDVSPTVGVIFGSSIQHLTVSVDVA
jgi:transglutaminase-like putative cysteine protease